MLPEQERQFDIELYEKQGINPGKGRKRANTDDEFDNCQGQIKNKMNIMDT